MAMAQMRLGLNEDAIATMDRAIAAGRTMNTWDHGTLALAHLALGHVEKAQRARDALRDRVTSMAKPQAGVIWFSEEVDRRFAQMSQ